MSDSKKCILCKEAVTIGTSLRHECGHRTHTSCFKSPSAVNYAQCDTCAGVIPDPVLVEPGSLSGKDYIDNPLPPRSRVATGLQKVASLIKSNKDDPLQLLSMGKQACPIAWMIREKKLGLQRFLENQVCLQDFLDYGHRWEE